MHPIPILTIQIAEKLLTAIEDFLDKSEADYALVIDRGGIILSQGGECPADTDTNIIAALAAGCFAATRELALRVGETDCAALYQQGTQHHILVTAVDADVVLVTVFGKQSTVGLVKFYSARATKQIAAIMHESRNQNLDVSDIFTSADLEAATDIFATGR